MVAIEVAYFYVSRQPFTPEYEVLVARWTELQQSQAQLLTLI